MKKNSFALLIIMISFISCGKVTTAPQVQPASVEKAAIDSFIAANHLDNMVEDSINAGFMYHINSIGDTPMGQLHSDTTVAIISLVGKLLNDSPFYQADSTLKVYYDSTGAGVQYDPNINSTLVNTLLIPPVEYYIRQLGKGGSIDFITPSIYAYAYYTTVVGNKIIPPNSPLYYQLKLVDVVKAPTDTSSTNSSQ